jgi:hypothetical protein
MNDGRSDRISVDRKQSAHSGRIAGWVRFAIFVLVAGAAIARVAIQKDFSLAGVFLGLGIAATLLAVIAALSQIRIAVLRGQFPDAFMAQIEVYSQLSVQLARLVAARGDGAKTVSSLRYATMVADQAALRLYGGVLRPTLLFEAPIGFLEVAEIAESPQGKHIWRGMQLVIRVNDTTYPLDLCLVGYDFGLSRPLRAGLLQRRLDEFRLAIHLDSQPRA